MYYKGVLRRIIIITAICAFFISNMGASFASESSYNRLQRDGKLRLIIKFNNFVGDRISYKLAGRSQVADDYLNEYILWKIDSKYNLKKLKKLFNDREMAQTEAGYADEFEDYYVIEIDKGEENIEAVCGYLDALYGIDMAEPDLKVYIETTPLPNVSYIPNDTYVTSDGVNWKEGAWSQSYPDMWNLKNLQVFEAWNLFGSARTDPGKDIVVAVIDTGVDFTHPDLGGNKWVHPDEIANNGVDDDGNGYIDDVNGWDFVNSDKDPYDDHGHGSHCAGSIAAVTNNSTGIAGIAPNARIMAVKGLSASGSGYISDLANCILYAANNGADVLSNSWGGTGSSSTLEDAVNYAYSRGCVIVAAAGNSNQDAGSNIPSSYTNVIAVAATDYNDARASFSNYGPSVDISAPGVDVMSTTGGSYNHWSGTSMACPQVSGVAALILSREPSLTNAQVDQRMKDTADNIYGQNPGWEGKLGAGRVNAYKAILAGGPGEPQNQAPVLDPIGNKTVDEGEVLSFTVSATDVDADPLIYSVVDLPSELQKSGDANFCVQSNTVYEGTRALQSGKIGKNQSCSVYKNTQLSTSGTVSFYWKVSSQANGGILSFYIDSVKQAEISGEVAWQEKRLSISSGSHVLKWTYSRNNSEAAGADAGWIDKITISYGSNASYDFEDGLMPAGFTTGGNGRFFVAQGTAYRGYYAMKATPWLLDNQYEYVQKTIEAVAGAEVSFWWKVSSEYYYDFLEFYIDNVRQARISGSTSWQKKTYALTAGTHTLKWRYVKDYSVTSGEDTGWVDDIVFKNGSEEIINLEPVSGQPNPLPRGASFNENTRTFTWTPDTTQAGTYPNLRFVVTKNTEDAKTDYEDITITVKNVSKPPVLDTIGNKTVNEMELLEFTVTGSDPEGDPLIYSASNLPQGAAFDPNTQKFSWRPTYQQAGIYSKVHFEVTDGGSGGGGGIDASTSLLLHLNTDFTDSSASAHALTNYGNASMDISTKKFGAASLKLDGSGDYLTAPDHDDWNFAAGDFTIDFWVNFRSVAADSSFFQQRVDDSNRVYFIWVKPENRLYFWIRSGGTITAQYRYPFYPVANRWYHIAIIRNGTTCKIAVDGVMTGTIEATAIGSKASPDLPATFIIGYENGNGYFNGWIDEFRVSKGVARWTSNFTPPTEEYSESIGGGGGNKDSEDITITVLDVNLAPVLNAIGNKTVDEGALLSFVVTATDQDGDVLTYKATNLPSGASFNTQTHTFSWTPTYTQAGTYSNVHFEVSDGKLTDSENITITVNNVNASPVMDPIENKIVNEGSLLQFTISATDSDGDALTYYALNIPSGASFDANSRTFSWTPDYTDAGTYSVIFMVSDGKVADGKTVTITVINVNRKPVINSLSVTPSTTIAEGESLAIVVNASDPDSDPLSYFLQNGPEGSGFITGNNFYWRPGYNQAGIYSNIIFTVYDGSLYSDPYPLAITVTNVNDAPAFITEPALAASYYIDGEAKDVKVKGGYAYAAYGSKGLKVFDVSKLNNIYETDSINIYRNLTESEIIGGYAYLIDTGSLVEILDISVPSAPYRQGNMAETAASDITVNGNTAYLACGETLELYNVTDKDYPEKLDGIELGKAGNIIAKGDYAYATSASEDLKIIDTLLNEVIATKTFHGAENYQAKDIAISGNCVYVAKDGYGIISFDATDPTNPLENGEFYVDMTAIKEIKTYNKDRIFAIGYISSTDEYKLIYIDSADPTAMAELWSYSFSQGLTVNSLYSDGNKLFTADKNGLDIIISPLESTYTVEAESELKITVYAEDPDKDSVTYTMNNKPAFDEAVFTDNDDGTATFTWTPTEAQIGSYADITFTADDDYQEVSSRSITINVVAKDTAVQQPPNLLLHCNAGIGFSDSSPMNHPVTKYGNASIDASVKKLGTGALKLDGSGDYLSVPDSGDWNFEPDDFTIDFWVNFRSVAADSSFFQQRVDDSNRVYFIWVKSENRLYFWIRSGGTIIAQYRYPFYPVANRWYHIAIIRNGTTCKIAVDGVMTGTIEATAIGSRASPDLPATFIIGYENGSGYFNGWIDEFRVSKGVARWTSNFTPPTEEY